MTFLIDHLKIVSQEQLPSARITKCRDKKLASTQSFSSDILVKLFYFLKLENTTLCEFVQEHCHKIQDKFGSDLIVEKSGFIVFVDMRPKLNSVQDDLDVWWQSMKKEEWEIKVKSNVQQQAPVSKREKKSL